MIFRSFDGRGMGYQGDFLNDGIFNNFVFLSCLLETER